MVSADSACSPINLLQHQMPAQLHGVSMYLVIEQTFFIHSRVSAPRYKTQKFKDWLLTGAALDIKPNPLAIEVLSYLALETVAQVRTAMDLSYSMEIGNHWVYVSKHWCLGPRAFLNCLMLSHWLINS